MVFAMTDASTETAESAESLRLVEGGKGLVVSRIGKSFNKRPVVRSVSLSLRRGEAVGLLGPNGAGKTTCFYMITGLIAADTGSIEVDGHDVTRLPMYRRARLGIGYLPQATPDRPGGSRIPWRRPRCTAAPHPGSAAAA